MRGFTLVELLVVIVIIGILAVALVPKMKGPAAYARDQRRKADVRDIQAALELYYIDHGQYPETQGIDGTGCGSYTNVPNPNRCNSTQKRSDGRWIANGALSQYLTSDPVDPKPDSGPIVWNNGNNTDGGVYFYSSNSAYARGCRPGQFYFIIVGMEVASNRNNSIKDCNGSPMADGGSYFVGVMGD